MTPDELRAIRLDLRNAESIDDEHDPKRVRTQQHPIEIAKRLLAEVERLQSDLRKLDDFAGGMIVERRDATGQAVGPTQAEMLAQRCVYCSPISIAPTIKPAP